MVDYILNESEYPNVPHVLSSIDGFASSSEYELIEDSSADLPGVVAAAFTRYLVRLQEEHCSLQTGESNKVLDDCYRVLESLAESDESAIRVMMLDEVFDTINCTDAVWRAIEENLGPSSTALLCQWNARNQGK